MTRLAGRYELQRRLAEGGMAEVWLATAHGDAGFTRRVAIKQLFPREEDGGAFERMFLDEARITSRLHHASIVSILDFGVEAGRAFQVLELIDGFDVWRLAKWGRANGKPMPAALALHVCAVVGHALHFAHVATSDDGAPLKIVHRDVSPQNILVSRTGDVKLSDFGIAFAEGRLEKTVGGVARGKPAYMAPEQAIRGALDGRTDVFALGCVLHALLTGESALRDENALVDLLAGQELKLSSDSSLSDDVRAVIAKATRRNKAERYESAEAMALACEALAAGTDRRALAAWIAQVAPAKESWADSATPTPMTPAVSPGPLPAALVTPAPRPSRARVFAVVIAGAALAGVGGAKWLVDARARGAAQPSPAPAVEEIEASAPAPAPAEKSVPVEQPARGADPTPAPVAPKASTPPKPVGEGVISIGGEALLRGEVFIDGKTRGFAPGRFDVPVGPHKVEVVTPDGQRRARELNVTRLNTPSAPLTWVE
ncbi:MAG: protein kinase [Archangium sp.]|nr:protein kinase [Archangium sp.]